MSQRRAKGTVVAGVMQAPANAQHYPHTKQLELGAVTVVLHSYPSKLPTPVEADELVRRQAFDMPMEEARRLAPFLFEHATLTIAKPSDAASDALMKG